MKHNSVANPDAAAPDHRDDSNGAFCTGLLAGGLIGAGLALWFAPRSGSELREQLADSARTMGKAVTNTVDEFTERGRDAHGRRWAPCRRAARAIGSIT